MIHDVCSLPTKAARARTAKPKSGGGTYIVSWVRVDCQDVCCCPNNNPDRVPGWERDSRFSVELRRSKHWYTACGRWRETQIQE